MTDVAVKLAGPASGGVQERLRPICDESIGAALAVLERGFPNRGRDFWKAGFERHRLAGPDRSPGAGYILQDKDGDAGVILTFASERETPDGARRRVVNLSSWYIDPPSRSFAPKMLRAVLADRGTLYTDVSATPTVRRLNSFMGFRTWNEGLIAVLVPCARLTAPASARVVPLDAVPDGSLPAATLGMLDDHRRLGCLVGALETPDAWQPLIFVRARRCGVPAVRLIYADDRHLVRQQLGAIARYLMDDNQMLLLLDGGADEALPGKLFFHPRLTQFKGDMRAGRIDMAYSELVYLNMLT